MLFLGSERFNIHLGHNHTIVMSYLPTVKWNK